MTAEKETKGRVRRWLDRRRDAQRRGADITQRAKAARKGDMDARRRSSGGDSGGPFIGGI
jgi:hypothetical protein